MFKRHIAVTLLSDGSVLVSTIRDHSFLGNQIISLSFLQESQLWGHGQTLSDISSFLNIVLFSCQVHQSLWPKPMQRSWPDTVSASSLSLRTTPLSETPLHPSPKATEWKLSLSWLTSLWTRQPASSSKKPWGVKISASWWTVWTRLCLPLRAWLKCPSRACWSWWIRTSRLLLWWPGWCCRGWWSAAEELWSIYHRVLAADLSPEEWHSPPPLWDETLSASASCRPYTPRSLPSIVWCHTHSIILFAFLHLIFQGYLDHFSKALHMEYSGRGIFVQSLIPFQVDFLMWPL